MTFKLTESPQTPEDWRQAIEQCADQLSKADPEVSVRFAESVIDKLLPCPVDEPAIASLFYRLGETLCMAGKNEEALAALTKAINIYETCDPTCFAFGRAMTWSAYCLLQLQRSGEASSLLRRAVKLIEPYKDKKYEDWLWAIATYAHHTNRVGRKRDALHMLKKCRDLAHVDSERLMQSIKVCADLSKEKTKVGEEAALLLKDLLDSRKTTILERTSEGPALTAARTVGELAEDIATQRQTLEEVLIGLEDLTSKSTTDWIRERLHLSDIALLASPSRLAIHTRAVQLHAHSSYSDIVPRRPGNIFYFFTPAAGNKRYVMVSRNLNDFPRAILRPTDYDDKACIAFFQPSDNGQYIAYGLSFGGSDWKTVKVRNVDTGQDLTDSVEEIRSGFVSWVEDKGFFYQRCSKPADGEKLDERSIYYHELGTHQDSDVLVFRSEPGTFVAPWVVQGWLFASVYENNTYRVRYFARPLGSSHDDSNPFCALPDRFGDSPTVVSFIDGSLYLFVFDKADRGKLVRYDLRKGKMSTLLPESEKVLLRGISTRNKKLLILALNDGRTEMTVHDRSSGQCLQKVDLGDLSHVSLLGFSRADTCVLRVESYANPPAIKLLDLNTFESRNWLTYDIPFDSRRYTSEIVYCRSADGTRVPIHVCRRRDISTKDSPVLINIYGGFQHCTVPHFSSYDCIWLELGGTLAYVVARGGMEYGLSWHEAGSKENKYKVVQDLLAARNFFVRQGLPSSRIGASGDSNGGLIVTSALAMKPSAFGAVVVGNPLTDMLKFHKWYGGNEWIREYGDPETPEGQAILRSYSPLQNLHAAVYPPTMVQVSINDDRVHKSHSYKFAHKLAAMQKGTAPVLLRGYESTGHAYFGDYSYWSIDRLAFFADQLDLDATTLKRLITRDRSYESIYTQA